MTHGVPRQAAPEASAEPAGTTARPMRLMGLLASTGFGGSQNSAMSMSNALAARGHDVTLFCDRRLTRFVIDPAAVRLGHIPVCPIMRGRSNIRAINALRLWSHHRRRPFDAAIVFNPPSLVLAHTLWLLAELPGVYYALGIAGGPLARAFGGAIVANSPETQAWLVQQTGRPAEAMPVVAARIPVQSLEAKAKGPCPQLDAVPHGPRRIVLASRYAGYKVDMAMHVLRAVDVLARDRTDVVLLVAGEGRGLPQVRAVAESINKRHGRQAVVLLGHVGNVASLFRQSDIVLGIGRGLWEGMALAKPAIVVGAMGMAGVVCPDTVEELAFYNFAGRNVTEPASPEPLAAQLDEILSDDAYAADLAGYSKRYILEHYDARVGAARLEAIAAAAAGGEAGLTRAWPRDLGRLAHMGFHTMRGLAASVIKGA